VKRGGACWAGAAGAEGARLGVLRGCSGPAARLGVAVGASGPGGDTRRALEDGAERVGCFGLGREALL
jgi:hypothetical protein